MKTCPNCKVVHADEYVGQCSECGAPLGSVQGSASGDLAFRYAEQRARANREDSFEQSVRNARGNARPGDAHDRAPIDPHVLDVARQFVIVPEEAKE